mgnify:FL=1
MKVLLSIKPEFVHKIFQGRKKYEYRKSIFARHVTKVIVYSTKPEGMIVGEFTIKAVLQYPPKELWERTHDDSGISKKYFDEYFEGRDKGYALQIENPVLYREPVNPFEIFDSFSAPQSFRYIREKKL